MVKLDAMENPYRLPARIAEALARRLAEVPVNRYPDPAAPGLKARLREAMGIDDSLEVLVGNGSDEILQIVTLALARPGAAVLSVEPSFVVYRMAALAAGMRSLGGPVKAALTPAEGALIPPPAPQRPPPTPVPRPKKPPPQLF